MNHSRYSIPYANHPLMVLLPRFYPGYLSVKVISNGETHTWKLEELPAKAVYPLILELTCNAIYTFYHCLPRKEPLNGEVTENDDDDDDEVREKIRTIIQKRIAQGRFKEDDKLSISFEKEVTSLETLLRSIPEVTRLGCIDSKFYIGAGVIRAHIFEVTPKGISDTTPYLFDLDEGFSTEDESPVPEALQQQFKEWQRSGRKSVPISSK